MYTKLRHSGIISVEGGMGGGGVVQPHQLKFTSFYVVAIFQAQSILSYDTNLK